MKTHSLPIKISYGLTRFFIGPLIRAIWVKDHQNTHHIKRHKGGAIIAANHQSFFDFLCLASVSGRNIHFLSAEKFFKHRWWRKLMKITGQIRVDRHAEDKSAVHISVKDHVTRKQLVGIFPEGTRSPSATEMLKAYTGIARYALEHRIPIIPVGIKGAHEIHNIVDKKLNFKKSVRVAVGEPMYFEKYYDRGTDHEVLIEVTEHVMKKIEELSGKIYPHYESKGLAMVQ
ncbi:MAG: hypothetical protein RJB39_189 [Candidatus Parcubacteria bacterium]|jgi:1-acyl-sn-glycerol-3-phosphate acyltransferase